jgi:hypothetical protein
MANNASVATTVPPIRRQSPERVNVMASLSWFGAVL